ncbi:TetR/AcrR family transcriptional regulator [Companilactobacillus jidongensis]|uniref:TetR/AcrR family transcriptional regulator n=1 Tax=Companilactobacillus jidongensis TaxID=2486006 RepID=UPI000F77E1FD|nr:TetR/AcrR family transcriptional regulator [Companilactobacillus jidongensis]
MVGIKNNRRAQYTRQVIQDAVLSLLENKAIGDIKVTEVCKLADINRTTFYRYYDDVFKCVESIETEFIESMEPSENMKPVEAFEKLLSAFYNQKRLSNLVFVEGKTKLIDRIQQTIENGGAGKPQINEYDKYQEVYMMSGMLAIMKKWVKEGMPETPKELSKVIIQITFADNIQSLRDQIDC